ncbi:MAG: DoxX family protein [Patescibacteria group bacterium]
MNGSNISYMIIQLLNLELSFFILRAVLGVFFIVHGYQKLFSDFNGTKSFLRSLQFFPAGFWAVLLGGVEFFGGIFIIFGFYTQIMAGCMALIMLIALARVKFGCEKFIGGWELDFLVFGIALALVFGLPGGIFGGFL